MAEHLRWRWLGLAGSIALAVGGLASPLCGYFGLVLLSASWWRLRSVAAQGTRALVWTLVTWSVPLALGPPLFSRDVYSYLAQGAIAIAGLDVYTVGPATLGGPLAVPIPALWQHTPAPYGPMFVWLATAVAQVTGADTVAGVFAMRTVALLSLALLTSCLPQLAQSSGTDPGLAVWLGALNPLVLLHFVAGAHNDALMAALLTAGLTLAALNRPVLATVLVTLAGLVKAPAFLGLLAIVYLNPAAKSRASTHRHAPLLCLHRRTDAVRPRLCKQSKAIALPLSRQQDNLPHAEAEPLRETGPHPESAPQRSAMPLRKAERQREAVPRSEAVSRREAAPQRKAVPLRKAERQQEAVWWRGVWRVPEMVAAVAIVAATMVVTAAVVTVVTGVGFGWVSALDTPISPSNWSLSGLLGRLTGDVRWWRWMCLAAAGGIAIVVWRKMRWDRPVEALGLTLLALAVLGPALRTWYPLWGLILLATAIPHRKWPAVVSGVLALAVFPHGYPPDAGEVGLAVVGGAMALSAVWMTTRISTMKAMTAQAK